MATLSITVPDTLIPRIVTAIQDLYPDAAGTPAQIGREGIKRLLADALADYERRAAERAGRESTLQNVDTAYHAAKNDAAAIT
jgi:hypothetical protein